MRAVLSTLLSHQLRHVQQVAQQRLVLLSRLGQTRQAVADL